MHKRCRQVSVIDPSVMKTNDDGVTASSSLPRLTKQDIEIGRLIGSGGFSRVFEVPSSKSFQRRLVIKTLQRYAAVTNPRGYAKAVSDLRNEGEILASLNHRNDVVSICGWSFASDDSRQDDEIDDLENDASPVPTEPALHFLVLDRLDESLEDLLNLWRRKCPKYRSRSKPIIEAKRSKILLDLAEALRYLHSCQILHRDLKPDNVGFQKGQLKLFDFGFARVLPVKQQTRETEEEGAHMTGMVGTLRYMSPECARREPYGLPADVYTFALICYEVLSLKKPFSSTTSSQDEAALPSDKSGVKRIWYGGERPSLTDWPEPISTVLQRCWDHDATARPCMEETKSLLANTLPTKRPMLPTSISLSPKTRFWRKAAAIK